jgi:hypothetical protein
MEAEFYWLALGSLTVWRLTHLFNAEDGPGDLLVKLRRLAGNGFWGGLLDCFYCLSLWFSAPVALYMTDRWPHRIVLWLGMSGAACLLERVTGMQEAHPVIYKEESEK